MFQNFLLGNDSAFKFRSGSGHAQNRSGYFLTWSDSPSVCQIHAHEKTGVQLHADYQTSYTSRNGKTPRPQLSILPTKL